MDKPKSKISRFFAYWRESLSASQEANDMILYVIFLFSVGFALVCELAGFKVPGSGFISDPMIQKISLLVAILIFVWILFWLPFRRHEVQEKKHSEAIENKELEIKRHQGIKPIPLELGALPPKKLPVQIHGHGQYAAEIFVHNENQAASGVKLKLLKIEPHLLGVSRNSDQCDLERIKFPLDGSAQSLLNPGETFPVRIFIASRQASGITIQFAGDWEKVDEFEKLFAPQYENQRLVEYFLTFETSANGITAHPTKFKMTLSPDGQESPFILEKINLGLIIHSAKWEALDIELDEPKEEDIYDVTEIIVSRFVNDDGKLEVLCEVSLLGEPHSDLPKF